MTAGERVTTVPAESRRGIVPPLLGALLGGLLGTTAGLRPALWVATVGGVGGALLLLPSPLPRFRMPDPAGCSPGWPR